ncbi:single-stranded DNA-binding protein 1-A, mitochondrial-like [Hydractinia symbiolongicarpus]|uniref:single-stranded DNA-binding protein 1-A, mitochondrial-like n=1 Tax=Hydractinia symbiolongicarpus TaxID=13093 RepID=UPI002550560C|nr:single-stranded DNA-binding protein 1-A, mitochondrial-like [Hydractinia symbiolongicarpus]
MNQRMLQGSNKIFRILQRGLSDSSTPKEKCLNQVQLLGRVGQDPVTRGEKENFVTFSMATSRSYPKKNENQETEYISKTEWHNMTVFRPTLVEKVQRFVTKGSRLLVTGAIEYVDYEKKDGGRFTMTRIVPDDIIILSSSNNVEK